jgi:hypothetical protein
MPNAIGDARTGPQDPDNIRPLLRLSFCRAAFGKVVNETVEAQASAEGAPLVGAKVDTKRLHNKSNRAISQRECGSDEEYHQGDLF